ncbi:arginine deiminase type-3 [Fusarium pseudocircinatum]|uniref:Arginine deiminase type-3 n=1 Tax=Fusarium pseudocircinatum TaxID=56676 RepID=A0A8H5P980_9HYPO|nr:arginine deiminase type-3 [Fusarium pseudocircinatum]
MRSLHFLALALCGIPLALAQGCCGGCGDCCRGPRFRPDIRADTNRDGQVDLQGFSDKSDKTEWNETYGAIFLPNIGDTVKRCLFKPESISDERLDDCRDASDNTLRSPEYLTTLKTVPEPDLFGNAIGTVTVADAVQRKFVRIFQKKGEDWVYIDNDHTFDLPELQAGLDLGIDARDTRYPESWDGSVTVCFTIEVRGTETSDLPIEASDEVMLRIPPELTHHHLHTVEQDLTQEFSSP